MIPIILTALTWLGRIGLAAFAVNEIKKLTEPQKETINEAKSQANASGVSDDEIKKLVAATTYEQVEKDGKDPDKFWEGLSPAEQADLKFSPQTIKEAMNRTTFLGTSQTLLWVAAGVAAGVAGFRGIPILLKTLGSLATARAAGASALSLMTIIEEGKIAGIAKVWIPGLIAGIASAGGWLTGALTNNLNDALLWGRIFLDQAHTDVEKAALARERGTGADGYSDRPPETRTRITISKTAEPKVAVGTLFQSIVKNTDAFKRVVDDQITSAEDLKTDVQLNMNKWLSTLLGRLHYEVRIVLNPLDENGNKKLGTWAVLMLGHRNSQGVYAPLQAIPLGPIEPTIYRPTSKEIETIQIDIPRLLTSEEVINLDIPTTGLRTVDNRGNVTPITFGAQSPTAGTGSQTGKTGTTPTPTPAGDKVPAAAVAAVQTSKESPYIRFGNNDFIFARLTGRYVPYQEAVNAGYWTNNLVKDMELDALKTFSFVNAPVGFNAEDERRRAIAGQATVFSTPPQQTTFKVSQPAPTPAATPTAPTAPAKLPYVRYLGSPNVFDRLTGRWIPEAEAAQKNILTLNQVEQFTNPRPEVKTGTDFAVWNNRNLSSFPV